jgi:hypothetical protein
MYFSLLILPHFCPLSELEVTSNIHLIYGFAYVLFSSLNNSVYRCVTFRTLNFKIMKYIIYFYILFND